MRSALLRSSGGGRRSSGGADRRGAPSLRLKIFRFGAEVQNRPDRFRSARHSGPAEPGTTRADGGSGAAGADEPQTLLDARTSSTTTTSVVVWSSSNVLAVALAVASTFGRRNEVSELLQLERGDCVTSVSWAPGGSHLCVGTDSAAVQLWGSRAWRWSGRCGATRRASGPGVESVRGVPFFLALRGDGVDATSGAFAFLARRRRAWRACTVPAGAAAARAPRRRVDAIDAARPRGATLEHAIDATPSTRRRRTYARSRAASTAARDTLNRTARARGEKHRTATLVGHQQEVTGLSWSADGTRPREATRIIYVSGTQRGRARRSRRVRAAGDHAPAQVPFRVLLLVLRRARAASRTARRRGAARRRRRRRRRR